VLWLELRRERFALAGEEAGIAPHRDEQAAELQPVMGVGFNRRENTSKPAGRADSADRGVDGVTDLRMGVVAEVSDVGGEVARPGLGAMFTFNRPRAASPARRPAC
jgi:hypothetical protein